MQRYHPYTIFPLGDSALTIDFGNFISVPINDKVLLLFEALRKAALPFITDLVPAYCSLTVYYNVPMAYEMKRPDQNCFEFIATCVDAVTTFEHEERKHKTVEVPVCYDESMAPDLDLLASQRQLSKEEVISLHCGKSYRVFMIGFLPGFAYMGEVDRRIAMERKPVPRTRVEAGSVGIAGLQTGIYPIVSPGGWQIIGRTPVQLFERERQQPILLHPGDEVQFYSISLDEFTNYQAGNS